MQDLLDKLEHEKAETSATGFEELLEQTMRKSMKDLLGQSSMEAIFFHLDLERPASDPDVFHERLCDILKAPGSIIEEVIVRDLYGSMGLDYTPRTPFDFRKSVKNAMHAYSKEKRA